MPHTMRRVGSWVREQRLPADERRAARAERKAEERLFAERIRTAPGAAPLRAEVVKAFASDGADGVLRQLSIVSPTARVRNGLQYLDFLITACAAAGVDHVFVFVDQLEDLATNKSITAANVSATALDVSTAALAATTITNVDLALTEVATTRSTLGAGMSRLDSVVNNLTTNSTNLSDARSRIEDADYSTETTALAKAQILSQASTAMIAQANQSSQNVMSLLR